MPLSSLNRQYSCRMLNYGLLLSPEINHGGWGEDACDGFAVNTPSVFCTRSSDPFCDAE